ncbi:MAG TPA: methyltransferase domain-containing protein [Noviherbaspirillum sp.]
MAHFQQAEFCRSVKERFPDYFIDRMVLDIGALDINGNNQFLFEECLYLGVDLAPGRNVDFVSKGHELALPDASFDVIISTECFEHDRFYVQTLRNIVRLLKPGGLFLFSCATTGRPEHGTRRTTPHDAPFIQHMGEWSDYYKNLEESDIRAALDLDAIFVQFAFSTNSESKDLYFWGIKQGELDDRSDHSFQLARAHKLNRADLAATVHELRAALHERDHAVRALQESVAILNASLHERTEQLAHAERHIAALEHERAQIHRSLSWRLTMPMRVAGRLSRGEFGLVWASFRARLKRSSHNKE